MIGDLQQRHSLVGAPEILSVSRKIVVPPLGALAVVEHLVGQLVGQDGKLLGGGETPVQRDAAVGG